MGRAQQNPSRQIAKPNQGGFAALNHAASETDAAARWVGSEQLRRATVNFSQPIKVNFIQLPATTRHHATLSIRY
jgi:hypothetical protein